MGYKFVLCILSISILLMANMGSSFALTKEQAQEQLKARQAALDKIRSSDNEVKSFTQPSKYKIICIQLSSVLITYLKNNLTTNYNYENLIQFDETSKSYAGKFIIKDGFLQRDKSKRVNNIFGYIQENKGLIVAVDCPINVFIGSRMLNVVSDDLFYKLEKNRRIIDNTIISYEKRFVDESCRGATVIYDLLWIEDTIKYLKSNCSLTQFDEKIVNKRPYSKLTYNGKDYQYQKWLAEMKQKCKKKC